MPNTEPKKLVLLGATGSIGSSTLRVLRAHKDKLKLVGVASQSRHDELAEICHRIGRAGWTFDLPKAGELYAQLALEKQSIEEDLNDLFPAWTVEEEFIPKRNNKRLGYVEGEPFMNDRQMEYFRRKLIAWKNDLLMESRETIEGLQDGTRNIPDMADRASEETDRALELRTRDRQRKLVSKIDAALRRIDEGEYGYCDVTGEPISLKRLNARPIATMSLEAQERHERREKVHRDD